jgi:hypothetical protein
MLFAIAGAPSVDLFTVAAAATLFAIGMLVAALAGPSTPGFRAPAVAASRELARRAEATRQRDPDAAGRPRPRAPAARPAAA